MASSIIFSRYADVRGIYDSSVGDGSLSSSSSSSSGSCDCEMPLTEDMIVLSPAVFHKRFIHDDSGIGTLAESSVNDGCGIGMYALGRGRTGPSQSTILPSSYSCRIAYRNNLFILAETGSLVPDFPTAADVDFMAAVGLPRRFDDWVTLDLELP